MTDAAPALGVGAIPSLQMDGPRQGGQPPSRFYAETRAFYRSLGYVPVEIFPELLGPTLPVLQLVKMLAAG